MHKSGFITIIGRPNVGKSTLINRLIGEKVSIVSSKPQTTRKNIRAILDEEDYQIIFLDTPGIHKPRHELGEYMVQSAKETISEVDLVVFMMTPCTEISKADVEILKMIESVKCTKFLVLNKIDENAKDKIAITLDNVSKYAQFDEYIPVSALKGKNVDILKDLMISKLKEGPKYYENDSYTDQSEKFIVSEILREKALRNLNDEIPHGIAIQILSMKKKNGIYNIEAEIITEKESHKSIIIGKNGAMIKKIGTNARIDMEKLLDCKVNLKVFVKVRKEWRDNLGFLNEFGYTKK